MEFISSHLFISVITWAVAVIKELHLAVIKPYMCTPNLRISYNLLISPIVKAPPLLHSLSYILSKAVLAKLKAFYNGVYYVDI